MHSIILIPPFPEKSERDLEPPVPYRPSESRNTNIALHHRWPNLPSDPLVLQELRDKVEKKAVRPSPSVHKHCSDRVSYLLSCTDAHTVRLHHPEMPQKMTFPVAPGESLPGEHSGESERFCHIVTSPGPITDCRWPASAETLQAIFSCRAYKLLSSTGATGHCHSTLDRSTVLVNYLVTSLTYVLRPQNMP